MKRTYLTPDGTRISGTTARSVLKFWRAKSRSPERTLDMFVNELAVRAYRLTGKRVRTGSQAGFIARLVEIGLLKEKK